MCGCVACTALIVIDELYGRMPGVDRSSCCVHFQIYLVIRELLISCADAIREWLGHSASTEFPCFQQNICRI